MIDYLYNLRDIQSIRMKELVEEEVADANRVDLFERTQSYKHGVLPSLTSSDEESAMFMSPTASQRQKQSNVCQGPRLVNHV